MGGTFEKYSKEDETMSNYKKLLDYYKKCFALVDCLHFNSEVSGNVYKRYLPSCNGKVISITHCGIKDNRRHKNFKDKVLHIGFIGNSTPYKGLPLLISTLESLGESDSWDLSVWGGGVGKHPSLPVFYKGKFGPSTIADVYDTMDVLVCNAGMTLRKGITNFSDKEWERVMQVNVNAPVFLIRDLFNHISRNARIVFIGSEMGIYPHGTSLAYGVTKSAVHSLAKNLVKFFEGSGTTVNVIAPGFVETEWQKDKPEDIKNNICKKTALGRFATVEEIADAVRFVVNNPFVNGSIIEVNGGYNYK